jgi:hypothetical protein
MLRQYQQQLRSYKAQLDTTREDHLDTERTE